jgi:hypothetical protein
VSRQVCPLFHSKNESEPNYQPKKTQKPNRIRNTQKLHKKAQKIKEGNTELAKERKNFLKNIPQKFFALSVISAFSPSL